MSIRQETSWKQEFFSKVEPIILKDHLAYVLGAQDDGEVFVFNYTDAVKCAGHSCPAVSSAFKATYKALKFLYPDSTPVRGEIRVLIKGGPTDLAYAPQAQVISYITGASGVTGFKGLGGAHSRNNKLAFDAKDVQFNQYIFQREDNKKAVRVTYDPGALPQDGRMGELIGGVLRGVATKDEKELFFSLWQGNVKRILLEDDSYPGLFTVEEVVNFKFPRPGDAGIIF